jgi:hypothetical protein
MPGRLRPEQVADFDQNPRPTSPEYALGLLLADTPGAADTFHGGSIVYT